MVQRLAIAHIMDASNKECIRSMVITSGEIDIVESRGNGIEYTAHGSNFVQGSLNCRTSYQTVYRNHTKKLTSFSSGFHTYVLEWTLDFLRIYVDTRLHTLLDFRFNQPFFKRGDFPQIVFNGSGLAPLPDPWINRIRRLSIAIFLPYSSFFLLRQYCIEFYLIMNVGVGSTNGWFPDGQGKKTVD